MYCKQRSQKQRFMYFQCVRSLVQFYCLLSELGLFLVCIPEVNTFLQNHKKSSCLSQNLV